MNCYIFSTAERLQRNYKTRDPFELLDAMRVVVSMSNVFRRDGLKGFCTILNQTKYVVINSKLDIEEQRVVAGHECGHIVVHPHILKLGAFKDHDVYQASGKLEREANFFAADFLISDEEVLDLMGSSDANFFSVAKELSIPEPFFAFKLYSMVERGFSMRMPTDLNSTFLAR